MNGICVQVHMCKRKSVCVCACMYACVCWCFLAPVISFPLLVKLLFWNITPLHSQVCGPSGRKALCRLVAVGRASWPCIRPSLCSTALAWEWWVWDWGKPGRHIPIIFDSIWMKVIFSSFYCDYKVGGY